MSSSDMDRVKKWIAEARIVHPLHSFNSVDLVSRCESIDCDSSYLVEGTDAEYGSVAMSIKVPHQHLCQARLVQAEALQKCLFQKQFQHTVYVLLDGLGTNLMTAETTPFLSRELAPYALCSLHVIVPLLSAFAPHPTCFHCSRKGCLSQGARSGPSGPFSQQQLRRLSRQSVRSLSSPHLFRPHVLRFSSSSSRHGAIPSAARDGRVVSVPQGHDHRAFALEDQGRRQPGTAFRPSVKSFATP